MAQIPVVSLNLSKLEANPGMTYTPALAIRAVQAIVYGDIFMRTVYRMRPYEKVLVLSMQCMKNGNVSATMT